MRKCNALSVGNTASVESNRAFFLFQIASQSLDESQAQGRAVRAALVWLLGNQAHLAEGSSGDRSGRDDAAPPQRPAAIMGESSTQQRQCCLKARRPLALDPVRSVA